MDQAYFYKGKTMLLERYLVLEEIDCEKSQYDIFDCTLNPKVCEKLRDLNRKGNYDTLKIYEEQEYNLFNSFIHYGNTENKKIYLYAQIHSSTRTKIIVNSMCSGMFKIYLNERCLAIHHYDYPVPNYATGYLEKGVNSVIVEVYLPNAATMFFIQIKNYKFEMGEDARALSNMGEIIQLDPLKYISEPVYQPTGNTFRFMCFKNNPESLEEKYVIYLFDSSAGLVKESEGKLNQPVTIDIQELRNLSSETLRYIGIVCNMKHKNGTKIVTSLAIYVTDFEEQRQEIIKKAAFLAEQCNEEIECEINSRLEKMDYWIQIGNTQSLYWFTVQLKEIIDAVETGTYQYQRYKQNQGMHEFYIHSELDDTIIRIMARIPINYDAGQAYPVILSLSTAKDGCFGWQAIENIIDEPCLCFDVTGRGFSGGSYIGEASTLEVIQWIKENYKIDEDRLYILGQSNGGYATYSIAQNHPDLPAAIFPQIGRPTIETIENITNIPTYQTISPKDPMFKGKVGEVRNRIGKYGNYHQLDFQQMLHHHFNEYIYHKGILNEMFQQKRNLYPSEILYKTCRNRHLKSFWITVNGIAKGMKYAKIKANIETEDRIKITVAGTKSIAIKIPPQINRSHFTVILNQSVFDFENYMGKEIIFERRRKWVVSDHRPCIDFRKGTGLLDVYLNRLRIIVPQSSEDDTLKQIAENFSKPYTNGIDPVMYTDYPIYVDGEVPAHIYANNLILLDYNHTNSYVNFLKDKLLVAYDDSGYMYKGKRYNGDYVMMQVIANPYDPRLSILVISTNNLKMLRKNLFTRKMVLPYYATGLHPYWNNEALIFTGDRFLALYETDGDLTEVKQ